MEQALRLQSASQLWWLPQNDGHAIVSARHPAMTARRMGVARIAARRRRSEEARGGRRPICLEVIEIESGTPNTLCATANVSPQRKEGAGGGMARSRVRGCGCACCCAIERAPLCVWGAGEREARARRERQMRRPLICSSSPSSSQRGPAPFFPWVLKRRKDASLAIRVTPTHSTAEESSLLLSRLPKEPGGCVPGSSSSLQAVGQGELLPDALASSSPAARPSRSRLSFASAQSFPGECVRAPTDLTHDRAQASRPWWT